mmetsp:Transcript_40682/g.39286  ORF Transcript_40682/g.39286 Transcript_40682/m.39286 type:complete len:263 (-) Transcript_40682:1192-1980(-)
MLVFIAFPVAQGKAIFLVSGLSFLLLRSIDGDQLLFRSYRPLIFLDRGLADFSGLFVLRLLKIRDQLNMLQVCLDKVVEVGGGCCRLWGDLVESPKEVEVNLLVFLEWFRRRVHTSLFSIQLYLAACLLQQEARTPSFLLIGSQPALSNLFQDRLGSHSMHGLIPEHLLGRFTLWKVEILLLFSVILDLFQGRYLLHGLLKVFHFFHLLDDVLTLDNELIPLLLLLLSSPTDLAWAVAFLCLEVLLIILDFDLVELNKFIIV